MRLLKQRRPERLGAVPHLQGNITCVCVGVCVWIWVCLCACMSERVSERVCEWDMYVCERGWECV